MAINKDKNVMIQITIPKEDAEQLETLKSAFEKNGIKVSKSEILLRALRNYISLIVITGAEAIPEPKQEAKEEKKDA